MKGKAIAIGVGLAGTSVLIYSYIPFTLSGLDLFFAATTVVSLGINLWQVSRERFKYDPLKNSLIAVFNDLKGKQLRTYNRQQLLLSPSSQKSTLEAIHREFFDFTAEMNLAFEQLKEHTVGQIHTLDPSVKSADVFQAAVFGMSEDDLRRRKEYLDSFASRSASASGPQAGPSPTTPPTPSGPTEARPGA